MHPNEDSHDLDSKFEEKKLLGVNDIFENEKLTSKFQRLGPQELNAFVSKDRRAILEITAKRLGERSVAQYVLKNCKRNIKSSESRRK